MKIDFLLSANFYGGPTRVVSEVSSELARRGHDVAVVVPLVPHWTYYNLVTLRKTRPIFRPAARFLYALKGLVKEVLRHRWSWVGGAQAPVKVRRCLTTARPARPDADWVVLSNNWYQVYDWKSFNGWSERIVQMVYHYEVHEEAEIKLLVDSAFSRPFKRMTLCRTTARDLAQRGITAEGVLFLGIDPMIFHPSGGARREKSVVLYWGLEPRKGAAVGLKAMEMVRARFPQAPIRILCPDERAFLPSGFDRAAAVSDLEMADLFRSNAIFVYPSLKEGFGLPPLEAMACGSAVVATRVGAVEEFSTHRKDAYLVPPGDAEALAAGVVELLENDGLRRSLGENAAARALDFTWSRCVDGLEAFLKRPDGR